MVRHHWSVLLAERVAQRFRPDQLHRGSDSPNAPDPEQLYRQLPRGNDAPKALWVHQGDVLRAWHERHRQSDDVALELPTGAGKTLIGGLIGEWWRRERDEPVAYLCPTRQLARQTAASLERYGIAPVLLTGRVRDWDAADRTRFEAAKAVAVSVYSHVFNSKPAIGHAGLLLCDDAHAAEGFVMGPWRLAIEADEASFSRVLDVLESALDPLVAERIRNGQRDDLGSPEVYLASPVGVADVAGDLEAVLHDAESRNQISTDASFAFRQIRQHLAACMAYLSARSIEIRPLIPPTITHSAFTAPTQRLYMSATVGHGGELERAFGRRRIERIPAPAGWDRRGTGRRLFVVPSLTSDLANDPAALDEWTSTLVRDAAKSVVLTPDRRTADRLRSSVLDGVAPLFDATDIETDADSFVQSTSGHLVLSNRYDGIDLPDDACRLVVVAGLPARGDLQERFLHESLGAPEVLQERIRARVVQGAGRATRHEGDFAVVVLLGDDLTRFCARRSVQAAMHPDIHVELSFGIDNSIGIHSSVMTDNIGLFLAQGADWRAVEADLVAELANVESIDPPGAAELQRSARHEVEACDALWAGNLTDALHRSRATIDALRGGRAPQRFAALWHYLAASIASRLVEATGDTDYTTVAHDHYRRAHAAGRGTTWLTHLASPADRRVSGSSTDADPIDQLAAQRILDVLTENRFNGDFETFTSNNRAALQGRSAADYERALVDFGRLAGATHSADHGDATAAPDAVWEFGDLKWISWEAKSDAEPEGELGVNAAREAGSHLRYHSDRVGRPFPGDSIGVIVAPQQRVHPAVSPIAEGHLYLARPGAVVEIFDRILRSLREARGKLASGINADQMVEILRLHSAAPTQWSAILAASPLGDT